MRIPRRKDRTAKGGGVSALRFEYCCGAECDEECRRKAVADEVLRMSPPGLRVG